MGGITVTFLVPWRELLVHLIRFPGERDQRGIASTSNCCVKQNVIECGMPAYIFTFKLRQIMFLRLPQVG
jgi:hypothetical protein